MAYLSLFIICRYCFYIFFFFQAEDGIRDTSVTGVQTWLFRSHVGELELFSQHLRTTRTEQQRLVVAGDQDRTPPDFSANVKQEIHRPFGMAVGDVPDILSLAIAREECCRSPTAGHGVHGHSQSAEAAQDAKSTVACRLDSPQHDNWG